MTCLKFAMFPWALVVTWLVLEAWPGVGAVDAAGPLVVKYAKKQPAKVTVKVRSTTPRPETGNPQDAIQPDDSTSIILGNIKPEPPPAIDKRVHLANVEAMKRRVASFYVSHNRAATYDPLSLCDRLDWISFMTTQLIKNPKLKIKLNKLLEEGKLGEKRNKGMCGAFFGLLRNTKKAMEDFNSDVLKSWTNKYVYAGNIAPNRLRHYLFIFKVMYHELVEDVAQMKHIASLAKTNFRDVDLKVPPESFVEGWLVSCGYNTDLMRPISDLPLLGNHLDLLSENLEEMLVCIDP